MVLVLNESRKTLLASRLRFGRAGGAEDLSATSLSAGEGMWIDGCSSFDARRISGRLDVLFLDRESMVVVIFGDLRPCARRLEAPGAASMLALPPGTVSFTRTEKGDRIVIEAIVPEPREVR